MRKGEPDAALRVDRGADAALGARRPARRNARSSGRSSDRYRHCRSLPKQPQRSNPTLPTSARQPRARFARGKRPPGRGPFARSCVFPETKSANEGVGRVALAAARRQFFQLVDVATPEDHILPIGKAIVVRPVGVLAHSFDHRAFDGAYSGAFLRRVREILETRDWAAEL